MTERDTRALVRRIKAGIPRVAFRTNFIVGFPGETEEHFETLLRFIEEEPFDHVVVFAYEREPETPSHAMTPRVPINTRRSRRARLLAPAAAAVARTPRARASANGDGDDRRPGGGREGLWAARTAGSAWEVDGGVVVEG